MLQYILFIAISVAILWKTADWFVEGAVPGEGRRVVRTTEAARLP